MDATRFELRTDGYGWDRIWDREQQRFLPGRHHNRSEAEHRVLLLNQGAAVPAVQSLDAALKHKSPEKPRNLKLF